MICPSRWPDHGQYFALLHTDCDVINQAFTGNDAAQMVSFQHRPRLCGTNLVLDRFHILGSYP